MRISDNEVPIVGDSVALCPWSDMQRSLKKFRHCCLLETESKILTVQYIVRSHCDVDVNTSLGNENHVTTPHWFR